MELEKDCSEIEFYGPNRRGKNRTEVKPTYKRKCIRKFMTDHKVK